MGLKLFLFSILLVCIGAIPHQRIGGKTSILDDEIQRDSLSQELTRTKKSVDSGEIEDVAEKKVANEIEKRSSQGSSALWAKTTLNDVEMDRQKDEEEAKGDADRSRRQFSGFLYPIDFNNPSQQPNSLSSMRSASIDDAQLQTALGDSSHSAKTFSQIIDKQSILPMIHQPITHGVDEALPIYKPVQQVVQQVIQPIQPVIQPVVHPVQPVIQPVFQQMEPIVKPPVFKPIYHTPMQLPSIHQSFPGSNRPLPMIPSLHTPMCPCPPHLVGASRSADSDQGLSAIDDRAQDSQLQYVTLLRDASQLEQGGYGINDESRFISPII